MRFFTSILFVTVLAFSAAAQETDTVVHPSVTFTPPNGITITENSSNQIIGTRADAGFILYVSPQKASDTNMRGLIDSLIQQQGGSGLVEETTINDQPAFRALITGSPQGNLYHIVFALQDEGVVFVSASSQDNMALWVDEIDAMVGSLAPTRFGERFYESANSGISFYYPLGFTVGAPQDGFLIISNTSDSLPIPTQGTQMRENTYQILLYTDLRLVPAYAPAPGDTAEDVLIAYLSPNVCRDSALPCTVGDYTPIDNAANRDGVVVVNFPAFDVRAYVISDGQTPEYLIAGYGRPGTVTEVERLMDGIRLSLAAVSVSIPQRADGKLPLPSGDALALPSEWLNTPGWRVDVTEGRVLLTNNTDSSLDAGELGLILYTSQEALIAQRAFSALTPESTPDEIITAFIGQALISNAQVTPVQRATTPNGRPYQVVAAIFPDNPAITQILYVLQLGSKTTIWEAYVRTGWGNAWQPLFAEMFANFQESE
jgi:hypothetical protein